MKKNNQLHLCEITYNSYLYILYISLFIVLHVIYNDNYNYTYIYSVYSVYAVSEGWISVKSIVQCNILYVRRVYSLVVDRIND